MFKKREISKVKSVPVDPNAFEPPRTASEFAQRGMVYYARKSYLEAETDLRQAVVLEPKDIEGHYRLGMVCKALNKKGEAVSEFKTVVELLDRQSGFSPAKYEMIRRLAMGHMNQVSQGDWNLEKVIWKHS